jgi:Rod binding domain-containing protein
VSSIGMVPPAISLSEVRGTQAANNLKNADPGNAAKIQKSAREFEAVLLSHWLEQAEQSFASVPGSDQDPDADPGRDQFHAIAMQAVGSALTGGHGGLGIEKMVAKHLEAQAAHKEAAKEATANPNIKNDLGTPPISIKPLVTPKVTK